MASKTTVNTFMEGMNKDIDKSLFSNKSYLDALNFRIITTEGTTTGALENSKGNKQLSKLLDENDTLVVGSTYYVHTGDITYNSSTYHTGDEFVCITGHTSFTGTNKYVIEKVKEGQVIIGGVEMRDEIILFTTDNTGTTPTTGRSCIYKMTVDLDSEEMDEGSLELLYDDTLNDGLNSTDFLNFSTAYPIKAIARYETENVQKVYWTDGYNTLRFINTAKNSTVSGEAYEAGTNNYMSVDKFSLQPNMNYVKPVLSDIIEGTLPCGVVQYAYQYYNKNGSETTFSPTSDLIHITPTTDFDSEDYLYKGGESSEEITSKGCRVKIDSTTNSGFQKIRVVRFFYPSLNATPTVNIVKELEIPTDGNTVYINDTGSSLGELTVGEVDIANTQLFSCKDITTKDNRLFAANITEETFDVGDYDSRAVRFVSYTESGATGLTDTTTASTYYSDSDVTFAYVDNYTIDMTITNFPTWLNVSPRTVTDFLSAVVSRIFVQFTYSGTTYYNTVTSGISVTGENLAGTTATFTVSSTNKIFNVGGVIDSIDDGNLFAPIYEYEYTGAGATVEYAKVQDEDLGTVTITEPADNTSLSSWNTAGWSDYSTDHDGINEFNDPDNDYDDEKEYQYQSDCSTLGAEGPNITIGLTLDDFQLDDDSVTTAAYYYSQQEGTTTNPSYRSYASPFKTGKKSFQRGEVYRFWVVFYDEHGTSSFAQWICDFKMPSIKDYIDSVYYYHVYRSSGDTYGRALYPTFNFRNFPTGAVSAQIFVTPRNSQDRSVYSQGYGQLIYSTAEEPREETLTTNTETTAVKLMSPEVSYNRDLKLGADDYIEHLGYCGVDSLPAVPSNYEIHKFASLTTATAGGNNKAGTLQSKVLTPGDGSTVQAFGSFTSFVNYCSTLSSYGGTGVGIQHDNTSWTGNGHLYNLVNYRKNVFESQYNGNKYEDRATNYVRPCSDIVTSTGTEYIAKGGDTFITMYEVSVFLFDTDQAAGSSRHVVLYIPVESTINCNLDHGDVANSGIQLHDALSWYFRQESASDSTGWTSNGGSHFYVQDKAMYQYNTVYSQQSTVDYKIPKPISWEENNTSDTKIKNSQVKVNGETSDSWTNFLVNDFIEVDPLKGPVNALGVYNNNLYYFQDFGIGIASVNPRSLIQDNNASSLVLGTGGVLDRYDYISDSIGCTDKFSVVLSKQGLYWYDSYTKDIYSIGSNLNNLTKAKYLHSQFKDLDSTYDVRGVYDKENDEVIMTFMKSSTSDSFTLNYNETTGSFVSFYSFLPTLYIPYKAKFLSTTNNTYSGISDTSGFLWLHNSDLADRSQYYALSTSDSTGYYDSTLKVLFNPDYVATKVFDNLVFLNNTYTSDDVEVYNKTFDTLRCYNEYQNTDTWDLEYDVTYNTTTKKLPYQRRERSYTTFIPRNAVKTDLTSNPDIFAGGNLDTSLTYQSRMRDKHLVTDLTFVNDGTYGKFVVPNIGLKYRISYR